MKFFLHTTGCKANQWDSQIIAGKLTGIGVASCPMDRADLIVINACTLTEGAERDIRKFIHRARNQNPGAQIILAGCHAQTYPERAFGADTVLGQIEKFEIEKYLFENGRFVEETRIFPMEESPADFASSGRTRFFVKIQDGCDRFCAYCVVPFARGKGRSRPAGEVLRVMRLLREKGVKEAVLTGIEISAYGDPAGGLDLKGLLRLLEGSDTPPRIRISSVDPLYIDHEFIELVASSAKVAKSLHIPLQSGSNRILEKMGRRYTVEFMGDLVKDIHRRIANIGIGMDVIVGFPGETEEVFEETRRFLEETDLSYLHVFPFSQRSGTRAASMEDQVPDAVKKTRVRILRKLDVVKRRDFSQRFLGTEAWIIPERKLYRGLYMRGYTDTYLPVYVPYNKTFENNLMRVTIKGIQEGMVIGEIV